MPRRPVDKGETYEEKRAYQRGYNNGRGRAWKASTRLREIAVGWRTKARDGFGGARCDKCQFWRRGKGENVKWGYCSQDFSAAPALGAAWAGTENWSQSAKLRLVCHLVCHEDFACINWLPVKDSD